jgi:hypothetical protein
MERPENKKGAVVIRTCFGEVSAEFRINFDVTLEQMMNDEDWREAVKTEGGPFCYVQDELDIPF